MPNRGVTLEERLQRHETKTNQTFKQFLDNLCQLGSMREEFAERAAVSVLCALEQRLFGNEFRHLEAQLPLKLQKLLAQCERHPGEAPQKLDREAFLERIGEDLGMQTDEVEPVVRAVFTAVKDQVSEGEIEDVIHQLPSDFHDLWRHTH